MTPDLKRKTCQSLPNDANATSLGDDARASSVIPASLHYVPADPQQHALNLSTHQWCVCLISVIYLMSLLSVSYRYKKGPSSTSNPSLRPNTSFICWPSGNSGAGVPHQKWHHLWRKYISNSLAWCQHDYQKISSVIFFSNPVTLKTLLGASGDSNAASATSL